MDVITWLVDRFGSRKIFPMEAEIKDLRFELQEVLKQLIQARTARETVEKDKEDIIRQLVEANAFGTQMEEVAAKETEKAYLMQGRIGDLEGEIRYLKEQVEIYQRRLGLLPQIRQSVTETGSMEPIRKSREPFSHVAARIESQRREAYWKERAASVEAGVTGSSSEATPAVSDKES